MNETSNHLITTVGFEVSSADTDMFARLRLSAMANMLIQSAINSADILGFGFNGLREHNLFWVLSRLVIEIQKPLMWYDKQWVETWPKDLERILYLRDFLIRDGKDNVVAKATSGWLAIDLKSKRPKQIEGINKSSNTKAFRGNILF